MILSRLTPVVAIAARTVSDTVDDSSELFPLLVAAVSMRDPLNRFIDASKSNYTESLFAAVEFDPTTRELIFITRRARIFLGESAPCDNANRWSSIDRHSTRS